MRPPGRMSLTATSGAMLMASQSEIMWSVATVAPSGVLSRNIVNVPIGLLSLSTTGPLPRQ